MKTKKEISIELDRVRRLISRLHPHCAMEIDRGVDKSHCIVDMGVLREVMDEGYQGIMGSWTPKRGTTWKDSE